MITFRFRPIRNIKILVLGFLFFPLLSFANAAAVINFTDLTSGPDTGLGDGLGSGTVVTIWGQNLGDNQGSAKIYFKDSAGKVYSPYVYYWKRADGQLPSGPADLYTSHRMQEIAISIPDSASGQGTIYVQKDGDDSNTLPFTVRSGSIFHVKKSGSGGNDGSFNKPWISMDDALDAANEPGTIIYAHDGVHDGSKTSSRAVYWNNTSASSGLSNQFGIVVYPNSRATAQGEQGFANYRTTGQVISKYTIQASNADDSNGQPVNKGGGQTRGIHSTAFGRAVGNNITDQPGGCASGSQGAINGNYADGDRVSAYKILGNYIHAYGCEGSNKLHHTTYMSIRSGPDNKKVAPWEFGWNYLRDNPVKNGIHMYDENTGCGDITGTVNIHNNVVINQGGSGINVGASCNWTMDVHIFNNVVINAGLKSDVEGGVSNGPNTSGITIQDDGLSGTMHIYNNIVYKWNDDDLAQNTRSCIGLNGSGDVVKILWNNNICYTEKDLAFIATGYQADSQMNNIGGSNNVWYFNGSNASNAIVPTWDSSPIVTDPGITINGVQISVAAGSAIEDKSVVMTTHDIYGSLRGSSAEIGPVEIGSAVAVDVPSPPNPPSNITIESPN